MRLKRSVIKRGRSKHAHAYTLTVRDKRGRVVVNKTVVILPIGGKCIDSK
jgi:hypothetical protein